MRTANYTCPCCGAPLSYSGESCKLACASCGNSYDLNAIEAMHAAESGERLEFECCAERFEAGTEPQMQAYICQGCGAELMTEDTTTATECPYCGSPTILPERIQSGVKPEKVVPFRITREQAQKQFEEYFKGKRLLPNVFLNSRNRIREMRKMYVPYWLFDCDARANISYDAEKRNVERKGDWEITRTRYYLVQRSGRMGFESIPVDGSEKLDNRISESLEPYDLREAVPFQPAVLAGALADRADVEAKACEARAAERVETSIAQAMRDTVTGYSSVSERSRSICSENGRATPVLMPVWLITTEKEGRTYTFAINGQTGKLTCDVPADTKKSLLWGGGAFAAVMALAVLILALTDMIGSGTILIAALAAIIVALVVVGALKGQLKQAVHQDAAADYVREGSFHLDVKQDHYLYERTERRRIEPPKKEEPPKKN